MSNSKETYTLSKLSEVIPLKDIPVLDYESFCSKVAFLMRPESAHCLNYYAFPYEGGFLLPCFIADDKEHTVEILAHRVNDISVPLPSLTESCSPMCIFEREIFENYGLSFKGNNWLKPVRFAHDRADRRMKMDNYPFYSIDGIELHEVGVGPVHAGVIEPGHFRFICNGEKVLHLEIQLGYQHRGIESMIPGVSGLKRALLAESIAGDTAAGHSAAHARLVETLSGKEVPEALSIERAVALELERIAMHIGDSAALCNDVAYQLGQVVNESLRTIIINTTQQWCGNRFAKGLVRPCGTHYILDKQLIEEIKSNLKSVKDRFEPISERIFSMTSVLSRFDGTGTVTKDQLISIGAVGMAARTGGLMRDIRISHPDSIYKNVMKEAVVLETGDVMARALLRSKEVIESMEMTAKLLEMREDIMENPGLPVYDQNFTPESLAVSVVEGWRGEICHSAITGKNGEILHYKIKDPSFHNWMALALAVRNQEISDFPVCNKSFNLSYCGNDI